MLYFTTTHPTANRIIEKTGFNIKLFNTKMVKAHANVRQDDNSNNSRQQNKKPPPPYPKSKVAGCQRSVYLLCSSMSFFGEKFELLVDRCIYSF